jgi:lactate dehydrogenase-like 2-hydroxyacid dehydrogenase
MPKPTILLLGAYPDFDMPPLEKDYEVLRYWEAADPQALLNERAGSIRALATRGDLGANAALIEALPVLELIACNGVGVDAIDFAAARARGIKVTNTPDVLTDDVADLAIGLMIAIARLMPHGDALVRTGTWPKGGMPLATRMSGKRVGIVGLGRIGKAIAHRAEAFGMSVNRPKRVSLQILCLGF